MDLLIARIYIYVVTYLMKNLVYSPPMMEGINIDNVVLFSFGQPTVARKAFLGTSYFIRMSNFVARVNDVIVYT